MVAVDSDFEMKVRTGGTTCVADNTDLLTALNGIALSNVDGLEVQVSGFFAILVSDTHLIAGAV